MIPLCLLGVVSVVLVAAFSFLLGKKLGRLCPCCTFELGCRVCTQFKCKNALKHR